MLSFYPVKRAILKAGKERALLSHHHWIFSGALQNLPDCQPGEILEVFSNKGQKIGSAYFNRGSSLVGRMIAFGDEEPMAAIERAFINALSLRKSLFNDQTNAYRLINAEGDLLPGLILDRYHDALVLQIGTQGMHRIKSFIISLIEKYLPEIQTIYEKSKGQEGLKDFNGYHKGQAEEVEAIENGIKFLINFAESQKTGLFLDQREMRVLIGKMAKGKKVLNCFGYTGGFSLYAAQGEALSADTLDISEKALTYAKKNFTLNQLTPGQFLAEDIFDFLKKPLPYDLVILDPPAFAKKKEDIAAASKAYLSLNRQALEKMPAQSLLLTCSCSYHIDEPLFQKTLFQAALQAKREIKILSTHIQAQDHPINLYHPETKYLKSLLLLVI